MKKTIMLRNIAKLCGFTLLVSVPLVGSEVVAEEELIGSDEFRISCASCHGVGGRGDGKMAELLTVKPADLTALAKNNGGKYPFLRIFQMIDGGAWREGYAGVGQPLP